MSILFFVLLISSNRAPEHFYHSNIFLSDYRTEQNSVLEENTAKRTVGCCRSVMRH